MIESLRKNKKGIILMLLSSVCVCFGQLLWKLSVEHGILVMLCGFALYGFGALLMLIAYKFGKVSVLQPILSMNYALSVVLAITVLNEPFTLVKAIGVLLITVGVLLIAGGDDE